MIDLFHDIMCYVCFSFSFYFDLVSSMTTVDSEKVFVSFAFVLRIDFGLISFEKRKN